MLFINMLKIVSTFLVWLDCYIDDCISKRGFTYRLGRLVQMLSADESGCKMNRKKHSGVRTYIL